MSFADDLRRFGPDARDVVSPEEARAYCARLTAAHYENFSVVTRMTPPALRPAFRSIYAFCRWSDDLGDEVGDREQAKALLGWWRGELAATFEGRPRHPVMIALAEAVDTHAIPIGPFEDLISAFEQDQVVDEYVTFDQLLDYCTRSANPVGRLILHLARASTPDNIALSDATCTGLQLANFWQDVARDLAIGRIYLPREDRERFGYLEADLRSLRFTTEFRDLLAFEVERARTFLHRGWPLASRLPGRLAVDVDLFTRGGLAILDRIERQGFDVLTRRPEVGKLAKLGLLARSLLARGPGRSASPEAGRPIPAGSGRSA